MVAVPCLLTALSVALGWGLLSQFSPFRYFPLLSKQTLPIDYHVYIWQESPQLSCGDTCLIWMWFKESNMYFCEIENFAYGKINERSFSNPHPWPVTTSSAHRDCAVPGITQIRQRIQFHDVIIGVFSTRITSHIVWKLYWTYVHNYPLLTIRTMWSFEKGDVSLSK